MRARGAATRTATTDRACRPNLRGAPASCLLGWGLLVHAHTRHSRAPPGPGPWGRRAAHAGIHDIPSPCYHAPIDHTLWRSDTPHRASDLVGLTDPPYSMCLYLLGVRSPRDRGIILSGKHCMHHQRKASLRPPSSSIHHLARPQKRSTHHGSIYTIAFSPTMNGVKLVTAPLPGALPPRPPRSSCTQS